LIPSPFLTPINNSTHSGVQMISEHSLGSSSEFIEAELSQDEEHVLHLLEGMDGDVIWVNRTQKGIVPGTLDVLKTQYSDMESFHILESLVRKGMLDRIDNGILLLCPGCGSHASSIIKTCPSCGSIKLRERRKIVHAPCEHWGTFDEFKGGNTLTCPVCNDTIDSDKILDNDKGFSYSDPYFECQECKFSANRVQSLFLCISCKTKFQASNAVQLEQTGFTVAVEPVPRQEEPENASTEVTSTQEPTEPDTTSPPKKKRSLKLLDELEKMKKKRAKTQKTIIEKTEVVEETPPEPEIKQEEVEPQVLEAETEPERVPEVTPEPIEEVKTAEDLPEPITEEPIVEETPVESVEEEILEPETEVEIEPEAIEEKPVTPEKEETPEPESTIEAEPEIIEKEILEPKTEVEIEPKVIEEKPVTPEKEETPEPESTIETEPEIIEEEPIEPTEASSPEVEPELVEEEIPALEEPEEMEISEDIPEIKDVIEENLVDEQLIEDIPDMEEDFEDEPVEEDPEEDSSKVLFVVENQMVCNFVLEGLQESGVTMEINLIEDGSQALKALRRVYDMIIIDSELDSVDPNFVIDEMSKWKVKSPLIIIDEGTLGDIPKKLNVIAVLKRKQRDLRKIKKLIAKHL
jgi:hypothetical protein